MTIYGVAILAFCYLFGQLIGEYLGVILGVNANVGGVGFAMLLLIGVNGYLEKKGLSDPLSQSGILFWNQMYIPIIVAMAASQNVKLALSSGLVAIAAAVVPVLLSFVLIPFVGKFFKNADPS